MKSYKDGSRSNGPMKIMVDTLTDQYISELAAFFASQRCR
jgi:cytochrome c553